MHTSTWQAIVLDLGNVIFEWSSEPTGEARATLKSVMGTNMYAQYETGEMESEEFYEAMGRYLKIDGTHIRAIFSDARDSLQTNNQLVDFIRELKSSSGIAVYAMSNIPRSEIDYLSREYPTTMSVFDDVFASGYIGMRKPNPDFFDVILQRNRLVPQQTIFIDDKPENVEAAQQLGMRAIRFDGTHALCNHLESMTRSERNGRCDYGHQTG